MKSLAQSLFMVSILGMFVSSAYIQETNSGIGVIALFGCMACVMACTVIIERKEGRI